MNSSSRHHGAVYILFSALTLAFCSAEALPPVKTDVCIAFFRQMGLTKSANLLSDRAYVLNSVASFRNNVLRQPNAQAGSAEGFISATSGAQGLSRQDAAGRLAGIEDFMRNREGDDPGKFRFSQVVTLQGKENIRTFLAELRENIRIADKGNEERNLAKLGISGAAIGTNALASLIHITPPFLDGSISGASQAAMFVAMNLVMGTDSILRRPLFWDYRVLGQIEKSMREVERDGKGWALVSRNFSINPKIVETMRKTVDEEPFLSAATEQYGMDGMPLVVGTIVKTLKLGEGEVDFTKTWVGLDLLFEKNAAGEPELHVVMRGSEKRPEFPKKVPDKLKALEPSRPVFVPQLQPVPIRSESK